MAVVTWPDDFVGKVIQGDCRYIMKLIPRQAIECVITDPPWPGHKVDTAHGVDEYKLFREAARQIVRISRRLVVVIGCTTDVRLLQVPGRMPYMRTCWLRRVPGQYRGPIYYGADVAHVFGRIELPKGCKVIGGQPPITDLESEHCSEGWKKRTRRQEAQHPCYRPLTHMKWLVKNFAPKGGIVLDPFCGSGQTLIAAKLAGLPYVGIDIVPEYVDLSRERLEQISTQEQMDLVER